MKIWIYNWYSPDYKHIVLINKSNLIFNERFLYIKPFYSQKSHFEYRSMHFARIRPLHSPIHHLQPQQHRSSYLHQYKTIALAHPTRPWNNHCITSHCNLISPRHCLPIKPIYEILYIRGYPTFAQSSAALNTWPAVSGPSFCTRFFLSSLFEIHSILPPSLLPMIYHRSIVSVACRFGGFNYPDLLIVLASGSLLAE